MLTIIHGDDISQSRKFFLEQRTKSKDAEQLDGAAVTLTDLVQILEGGGLFSDSKNVFIEQLLSKKKKSTELTEIISYLQKNADEHAIFLWESKELERGTLMTFKTAAIRPFKLPQTLFAFLDSIKPGNGTQLVKLFNQTIENTEAEMVFFMLVRQFRLLLALSQPGEQEIDEIKRMTWQKNKLQSQAKLFTPEELKSIYARLFEIELAQKTGTLSSPLPATIDFLLLEI